ncbi:2-phosphoglycolate phosphatase [Polaromonas sp. CF318]|uniref:phosphoglycolate phosphatase n=1 Tax=Polaromonas sp. CF318 TaxID=1144318 RepID=UPI0002711096|nr:phosphoglycolate phosphatase [Polaromonas sp. CF318]EJL78230.1 2-phosphoglycolate phosphatase [Polaromonas sp. CF318]
MNPAVLTLTHFDAAMVDLDGTLVDTLGDFVAAVNAMLAELRKPGQASQALDATTVGRMVGKGSENLVKAVLAHAGAEMPDRYTEALSCYQRHYAAINGVHSTVYPGGLEGLRALQQAGLKLACLTNKPLAMAHQLLRLKGLDGFFSEVFGGDSFARKKPDPLPLLKTCEALGTAPARTLMIGDSSNDARAARAAGCPVLLVTYGYNHGEPVREVDADGFVDSLSELRFQK